jgi:uncharacterized protein YbcI
MPGFEFRYRLSGGPPTVRSLRSKHGHTLAAGDLLNFERGDVALAVAGDGTLVGAMTERLSGAGPRGRVNVIVDADAVYGVDDPTARSKDDSLWLSGASGAQGVSDGADGDLHVVLGSRADHETLVRINPGRHHVPVSEEYTAGPGGGELNAAIARAVVRRYREHVGRGPSKAQAFYRGNVLVLVLENTMTRAEQSLAASGQVTAVTQVRDAIRQTMRPGLVAIVEELTGCKVLALMSASHLDPDMASEVFVLDRPVASASE